MQSSESQCGQWLEFDKDDGTTTHLIPGSTFLGFTGGYPALERAGGRPIERTRVTREGVIGAVNELAWTTAYVDRARDLALLIMVICEATRFEEMSGRFADVIQVGSTSPARERATIAGWMMELFTSWGDLSGRLIRADADGDDYFRLPNDAPLRQRIENALDAARYVGLLLGPLSMSRFGAPLANAYVPRGQPMMEVLEVQITDFSGALSGTITVTDGLGPQTLFSGQQTVQAGDTLTLELLDRAITAWESVVFDYNLTAQAQYRGADSWDIFQPKDIYAEDSSSSTRRRVRLTKYGTTRSGSGEITNKNIVTYIGLFREAWQVIWEVKITVGDGYNPMNVYGSVTISYADGAHNYVIKLFSRSSDNNVVVYVGGCLPLTRKATAVPLDVDVNVDVDLWDYIHVFSDRCIASGRKTTRFGSNNAAKAKSWSSNIFKLAEYGNSEVVVTSIATRVSADY